MYITLFSFFSFDNSRYTVSTFGADQITDERAKESFFNYLYWFQNMGAFAAFTLLVYICQDVSFTLGFTLSAFALVLSLLVLYSGRSKYTIAPPVRESPVAAFFHVIYEGIAKPGRNGNYNAIDANSSAAESSSSSEEGGGGDWLDGALLRNGGSHAKHDIDMVRKIGRVMPVFFLLVVYWGVNSQMATTFFNQGPMHTSLSLSVSLSIYSSISISFWFQFILFFSNLTNVFYT
jgi:solute carrier family 15 (peptide/histidine transporter), member 3/4